MEEASYVDIRNVVHLLHRNAGLTGMATTLTGGWGGSFVHQNDPNFIGLPPRTLRAGKRNWPYVRKEAVRSENLNGSLFEKNFRERN
jgi:hypothetical protein